MIKLSSLKNNPYYFNELACLSSGALLPFSFAPYNLFWLQFVLLCLLFFTCIQQSPRRVFVRGLLFGLGWFAHGVHWIYYSLHLHGGAPLFLALLMVFLMGLVLALFPALALYLSNRFYRLNNTQQLLIVYPLMLTLFEWLRGYVLTGFPWLQLGYAHIDTPLSGYAPLFGGLGVGYIVALLSAVMVLSFLKRKILPALIILVVTYGGGYLLSQINWTDSTGDSIKVSLIQGNIPQSEKWKSANYLPTLDMYRELTHRQSDSDLIIWPETAIPGFKRYVNDYIDSLEDFSKQTDTDILLGLFVRDEITGRYYNAVIDTDEQIYKKRHLVPLGEYFPFRPLLSFFSRWINIPMSDLDSGQIKQPLMQVSGYKIAVNICFEDAFDRNILRDLPEAEILVNVSNDAWFEDSPQPWQHHQIARMRALETGRMLLRATNTGVSSIIGVKGEVINLSRQFQREVISAKVQAYTGSTPYVFWKNYLLIGVSVVILLGIHGRALRFNKKL